MYNTFGPILIVTWLDFYSVVSFYTIQTSEWSVCGASIEVESHDYQDSRELTEAQ